MVPAEARYNAMKSDANGIAGSSFVVCGMVSISRTETLEGYLRCRVRSLGVIGLMSPFVSLKGSHCTLYENGVKKKESSLPSFSIKKLKWWNEFLLSLSFAIYVLSVFLSMKRFDRKFDVFLGIGTFPSMLGVALRRMGYVNEVIYYCLDYFQPPQRMGFNTLIHSVYRIVDAWLMKAADIVWEISPRIKEARERHMAVPACSYAGLIVPLGYTEDTARDCCLEARERWTLGFVGTLSENQGLQMVIEAMPYLVKRFPEIKVRVIGHGPYAAQLREMVRASKVETHFVFHGFVRDDNEVYDILSRCMIGLATWTGDEKTDPSLYADPGKPKLYALLGLPIIITSGPLISELIDKTGAGEVIDYSVSSFVEAVGNILETGESIRTYREGVERFKPYCLAEQMFDRAFSETVCILEGKRGATRC